MVTLWSINEEYIFRRVFFGREICTLLKHKEKCRVDRTMEDSGARKKVDYVS